MYLIICIVYLCCVTVYCTVPGHILHLVFLLSRFFSLIRFVFRSNSSFLQYNDQFRFDRD